jgi:hypothetical protein
MAIINPGDQPIDPQVVDGTELAQRLNRLYKAVYSSHSNSSRPPDITAGGVWARTVTGGLDLMFYDGTVDHKIGSSINGVATFGGGGDKFAPDFATATAYKKGDIIWSAAGSRFEMANKDIAAGSAKAAGDWVASTDVISDLLATKALRVLPTGMHNRIINGDMRIDQRNAGAIVNTSSGASVYTVDRWVAGYTQTSKFTVQKNAGLVTPPAGFTNYLGVTSSSAYSVLTGDAFWIDQRIEGFNVADLGWGTANAQAVTVSFWVRSSLTGTFGGSVFNSGATRSYPFSYVISSANTWEQKSITIAGDTSGTWLKNSDQGILLNFVLGAGSKYSGTAGAWAGSAFYSAAGATSVVGTNGATFYITGVQLEKGSVATSFDYRPYGTELALCQRYFYTFGAFNVGTNAIYNSYFGGSIAFLNVRYPVQMRATPTATISQPTQVQYYSQAKVWVDTTITVHTYNDGAPNYNTGTTDITLGCTSDAPVGGKLLRLVGDATSTFPTVSVSAEL